MGKKNKTGKKALVIALVVILILAVLGAGGFFVWNQLGNDSDSGEKNDNITATDTTKDNEEKNNVNDDGNNSKDKELDISGVDTSGTPTLRLFVEGSSVNVGVESVVEFKVIVKDLSCETVVVAKTEDNSILTVLKNPVVSENNENEFSGTYKFTPKKVGFIEIRAFAGEEFSPEGYISVNDPATNEEHEEFRDVVTGLGEYLEGIELSNVDGQEELDIVEKWLKSNSDVSEVKREKEKILYITKGGLRGSHSVEIANKYVMSSGSSTSEYKTNTTAVEYYEKIQKGENLKNRDGKISYLPSDITITNKDTLMLRPTYVYHAEGDEFRASYFDDLRTLMQDSPMLEGGRYDDLRNPPDVMNKVRYGGLVDYGTVFLAAHGGYDSDYYFLLMDTTDKSEWERFYNSHKDVISSVDENAMENWKLWFETSEYIDVNESYEATQKTSYKVYFSSRYIEEIYQNHRLDNTIFFMLSCYGTYDDEFSRFLINHGAQAVIGSDESIWFDTMGKFIKEIITPMYKNSSNNGGTINSVWYEDDTCHNTVDDFTTISFEEYWEAYLNSSETQIQNFEAELAATVKCDDVDYVVNEGRISQFLEWQGVQDYIKIDEVVTESYADDEGNEVKAGTIFAEFSFDNVFEKNLAHDDFTFGGKGKLKGTVYEGRHVITFASNGTIKVEEEHDDEPLVGATVTAYRFLEQNFENQGDDQYVDETSSDSEGRFTLEGEEGGLDWGHYVLTAEYASNEGKASIILTSASTDGGELIVPMGDAEITGYIEGRKSSKDRSVISVKDAKIELLDSDGNVYKSTTSASDGKFEIKKIEAGSYTINITHKNYEDCTRIFNPRKGYAYDFERKNFILEPIDSDKDVVLVLDVSGSMSGEPLDATKDAAKKFGETVFDSQNGYRISLVSYADGATVNCPFTKYESTLDSAVSSLTDLGSTNTEAGLAQAEALLSKSKAKHKIILLMSDGMPNAGKQGSELISYAESIKNKDITIYTLGFFSAVDASSQGECKNLMASLASHGYHYEVTSSADLSACFGDMADQVNGTKYVVAEIACPVDVSVTYNGETLSSSQDNLCTRTSFGSLMFDGETDDPSKILRLREGVDYDIVINGTGKGKMNYTLSFVDENGDYSDVRRFEEIKITDKFKGKANTERGSESKLEIDKDGDGSVDLTYVAKENSKAEIYRPSADMIEKSSIGIYILFGGIAIAVLIIIAVILLKKRKPKEITREETQMRFCINCGEPLDVNENFCTRCGTKQK